MEEYGKIFGECKGREDKRYPKCWGSKCWCFDCSMKAIDYYLYTRPEYSYGKHLDLAKIHAIKMYEKFENEIKESKIIKCKTCSSLIQA